MSINKTISQLETLGERELLTDATIRYLSSLSPELADAAFHAAILRWFNAEVLENVMGVSTVSSLEKVSESKKSSQELYEQLKILPFTEEYPNRGHSFHDLTRELVLDYLWRNEHTFYRQVSAKARDYFQGLLNAQIEQSERGEIDRGDVDQDLVVEIAYHYLVASNPLLNDVPIKFWNLLLNADCLAGVLFLRQRLSEEEELLEGEVDQLLENLLLQRQLGTYHAVIQAVSEHAEAGRPSPGLKSWIDIWRLKEAGATYDVAQLESIAQRILESPDDSTSPFLKAQATYWLANGLRLASRYEDAKHHFEENLYQWEQLKRPDGMLSAVIGLGYVEFNRENYEQAENHFAGALAFHVQQLRVLADKDSEFGDDTPLRVFSPNAWHRRELYFSEVNPDQNGTSNVPDYNDELPQDIIVLYYIEFDTESLGIDTTNLSEDDFLKYEWPILFDEQLAELWLDFGYLLQAKDEYDTAAACANLAGQIYTDLDNLNGAQNALQLLRSLGAYTRDLEYVKTTGEFQKELLSTALARNDREVVLYGLIYQAGEQIEVGKYEDAQATYQKAYSIAESLKLNNQIATCWDGLARISWIDGDYDVAVERFHNALKLYQQVQNREGEADSLLSLGDLYLSRYQLDEAENSYLQALEIYKRLGTFSGRFRSLLSLSGVTTTKGNYDDSFKYLEEALTLSQQKQDRRLLSEAIALSEIAKLHLSLGQNNQAQDAFDKALQILDRIQNKKLAASILCDKADILSDMAEYAAAVEVYDQIIKADPTNSQAYSSKGWALQYIGKDKAAEAKQVYEKASELQPTDWWVHKGIANALKLSGDQQAAIDKYQWVVEHIEEKGLRPAYRSTLAWCYYQLGNYERSEEMYRQKLGNSPDSVSDYFDIGLVLLCRKEYAEAEQMYEAGIELLRKKQPVLRRRGLLYVALHDLKEAIERYPSLSSVDECNRIQEILRKEWEFASEQKQSNRTDLD